ncbi:hypothetical protein EG329_009496 [Mollisiaceae sp. DMI_Dod_QoI]|nr:hypothetical protein EG329_009496 [Helotiales sp. DMI_Dod_QoI]
MALAVGDPDSPCHLVVHWLNRARNNVKEMLGARDKVLSMLECFLPEIIPLAAVRQESDIDCSSGIITRSEVARIRHPLCEREIFIDVDFSASVLHVEPEPKSPLFASSSCFRSCMRAAYFVCISQESFAIAFALL